MTREEFDAAFSEGAKTLYSLCDIYKTGEKNMLAFLGASVLSQEKEKAWQKHVEKEMRRLKAMQQMKAMHTGE